MPTLFYSTGLCVQIYKYEYIQTTRGSELNSTISAYKLPRVET